MKNITDSRSAPVIIPGLKALTGGLIDEMRRKGKPFASLAEDRFFFAGFDGKGPEVRKSGLTFAPEQGTPKAEGCN